MPRASEAKRLVSVLVTSTPVTETRKERVETTKAVETVKTVETARTDKDRRKNEGEYLKNLARVPYIHYPINYQKKFVLVLFDSSNEVNAVHQSFAKEQSLPIRPTNVEV